MKNQEQIIDVLREVFAQIKGRVNPKLPTLWGISFPFDVRACEYLSRESLRGLLAGFYYAEKLGMWWRFWGRDGCYFAELECDHGTAPENITELSEMIYWLGVQVQEMKQAKSAEAGKFSTTNFNLVFKTK